MQANKGPISIFDPKSFENKDHIQEEFTSLEEVAEKPMSTSSNNEDKLDDKLENSFLPVVWPSVGFGFWFIHLFYLQMETDKIMTIVTSRKSKIILFLIHHLKIIVGQASSQRTYPNV